MVFIILTCFFISCSGVKETSSVEEYLSYFVDLENGLLKEVVHNNTAFTFLYETPEYIAIKEAEEADIYESLPSRVKELEGYQYFTVRINISQFSDEDKQQIRDYFFETAQNDFNLKSNNEELLPVIYHFEQDFGVLPYCTVFLGFKLEGINTDAELTFSSAAILNEKIVAKFSNNELNSIPKFKLPNT